MMTSRHQLITKHYKKVEELTNNLLQLEQTVLNTTLDFIESTREVYIRHCNSNKIVDHMMRQELYEIIVKHPAITEGSYLPLGKINGQMSVFKATANGRASCFVRHGSVGRKTGKSHHVRLMVRHPKDYVRGVDFPNGGHYYQHIQIRMELSINILGKEYPVYYRLIPSAPAGVGVVENVIFNMVMKLKSLIRS